MATPKHEFNKRLRAQRKEAGLIEWRIYLAPVEKQALVEHLRKMRSQEVKQ